LQVIAEAGRVPTPGVVRGVVEEDLVARLLRSELGVEVLDQHAADDHVLALEEIDERLVTIREDGDVLRRIDERERSLGLVSRLVVRDEPRRKEQQRCEEEKVQSHERSSVGEYRLKIPAVSTNHKRTGTLCGPVFSLRPCGAMVSLEHLSLVE